MHRSVHLPCPCSAEMYHVILMIHSHIKLQGHKSVNPFYILTFIRQSSVSGYHVTVIPCDIYEFHFLVITFVPHGYGELCYSGSYALLYVIGLSTLLSVIHNNSFAHSAATIHRAGKSFKLIPAVLYLIGFIYKVTGSAAICMGHTDKRLTDIPLAG